MSPGLKHALTGAILTCLAFAGCDDTRSEPSPDVPSRDVPSRDDPGALETRSQALERKALGRVPPPEPPAAVVGEVPDGVMRRIRDHLTQRTGAPPEAFDIVRAEAHEWPTGAMGCPQPGLNYTQAPIRGYWVVLRHGGRDYDYRVAESGHFVACEAMNLEEPPAK